MSAEFRGRYHPVSYVEIDGLVVFKIIKHCYEEASSGTELVQGVLLGLVENNKLEVTNCFPFPKKVDDDDFDESLFQLEMMKNLRNVNVDHFPVGWYRNSFHGAYLNKVLLDSQFDYQNNIDESIVLVYDPQKTTKGLLTLKALRLTSNMIQLLRDGDLSPEMLKTKELSFESMFEEVPVSITNSHLVNSLFCEVEEAMPASNKFSYLDLSSTSFMEKNLRLLIDCVDELGQDTGKFFGYQRALVKLNQSKQQYILKRQQENNLRKERGEAPLPDDDINKMFKQPAMPSRLDSFLLAAQISTYTNQIADLASQSLGKLFIADRLHEASKN